MKKSMVVVALSTVLTSFATAHAGSPFAKDRENRAAEKAKEREEKAKEKENKPAPDPRPEPRPERPRPDRDRDDHPYSRDKNRGDKDRDRRDRDRKDRDNWKRPRTVIIERPVYIPTFPPSYDPYNPYQAQAQREDALLEAVAKQMRFALRENPVLRSFNLDTDTVGDSVEIEGTVDTLQQMQLALDVARNIDPRTRIVITRIKIRQR